MTYAFDIEVDKGAQGTERRTITASGTYYEDAEDKAFARLQNEYKDIVAFFNLKSFKRV